MSFHRTWYDPWSEFDRLFDDAFSARWPMITQGQNQHHHHQQQQQQLVRRDSSGKNVFAPKMDVHENTNAHTVVATFELPGLKKEDVNIDLNNNRLTISGNAGVSQEREEGGYVIRERNYGSFTRTLQLPAGIKPDDIKASMENGVLSVTFPKTSAEQVSRKITVS